MIRIMPLCRRRFVRPACADLLKCCRRCRLACPLTFTLLFAATLPALPAWAVVGSDSGTNIFNGVYVNDLIGASTFYSMGFGGSRAIVANVEAGAIWNGQELSLIHI